MDKVRSRSIVKTATLLSLPFDIEFLLLTLVLMWRRPEKLRSCDSSVLTAVKATAILSKTMQLVKSIAVPPVQFGSCPPGPHISTHWQSPRDLNHVYPSNVLSSPRPLRFKLDRRQFFCAILKLYFNFIAILRNSVNSVLAFEPSVTMHAWWLISH